MKLDLIRICNFRSINDIEIKLQNLTLLVGENNAGKSNIIDAIRTFYDDRKFQETDLPKNRSNEESWIELSYSLNPNEVELLPKKPTLEIKNGILSIRRYFKSSKHYKEKQGNFYQSIDNYRTHIPIKGFQLKNIPNAILGQIIYIPSLIKPSETFKTSAASPFRNLLNSLLERSVAKQKALTKLQSAFENFCKEAKKSGGFIDQIKTPLNEEIKEWGIEMNMVNNPIKSEDIAKLFIGCKFQDLRSDNPSVNEEPEFALENYGGGFQRYVIYTLLRIIPTILAGSDSHHSNLNLSFNLILFEEPEIFLHPTQQENMAYQLFDLANQENYQIIIATHSAIFASKAVQNEKDSNENFKKIVRVEKKKGELATNIFQADNFFSNNEALLQTLQDFKKRKDVCTNGRTKAENLIKTASEEVSNFRLPLWLNHERSILFFSNTVLLVEGATEKALFDYLLKNKWKDLKMDHINIIDVLGKYNFHHFMALMKDFGIQHGVLFDDDIHNKTNQFDLNQSINSFIKECKNKYTLAEPVGIECDIEKFLGLNKPPRTELKPLYMLKALTYNEIKQEKLEKLREKFCKALNLTNKQ